MQDDDNSEMFQVEDGDKPREPVLFNAKTEIIEEGQRHKVVFGQMEEEKKTIQEIVTPYLSKFAVSTADLALQAGSMTYQALKTGFLWVYCRFVDDVIPYAVETLPKIVFVPFKKEEEINSGEVEVLTLEEADLLAMPKPKNNNGARVVIPLGPENEKSFVAYLEKEEIPISYEFPIDEESNDHIPVKRSFMMPSESFEVICDEVKESHTQLQIEKPPQKRTAFRLNNCFVFEYEGQNTIEYDLLDSIEKCKDAVEGCIVFPEQPLRRNASQKEQADDAITRLVAGKEKSVELSYQEKVVDMERNVEVDTTGPKVKPGCDLALN